MRIKAIIFIKIWNKISVYVVGTLKTFILSVRWVDLAYGVKTLERVLKLELVHVEVSIVKKMVMICVILWFASIYLKFESCSSVGYGGLDCSHCKVGLRSMHINFTATTDFGGRGVWLQSLQSWTAVTAHQLHCNSWFQCGEGLTAVTAELDCSHCTSTSLQLLILGGEWMPPQTFRA